MQGIWSPFYSSGPSAPLEGPSDRAHLLPLPADVVRLASGTASAAAAASTSTSSVASSVSGRSQVASASAAVELESDGSWATWDATRSTLSDRVRQLMREQQAPTRTRAASASSDRTAAAASTSAKTAVSSRSGDSSRWICSLYSNYNYNYNYKLQTHLTGISLSSQESELRVQYNNIQPRIPHQKIACSKHLEKCLLNSGIHF